MLTLMTQMNGVVLVALLCWGGGGGGGGGGDGVDCYFLLTSVSSSFSLIATGGNCELNVRSRQDDTNQRLEVARVSVGVAV